MIPDREINAFNVVFCKVNEWNKIYRNSYALIWSLFNINLVRRKSSNKQAIVLYVLLSNASSYKYIWQGSNIHILSVSDIFQTRQ